MKFNLRHLRVFLAVADQGSVTKAAISCRVTQPAVTQALAKLEHDFGLSLLERTAQGMFLADAGRVLADRARRAFALLDPALSEVSTRLLLTVTHTQLRGLIAVREAESYTLAANRLGVAQPTVHRTIAQLEQEARQPLFTRTARGIIATRQAEALAQAARLTFVELDQAEADLHEFNGREVGKIVIGAMPLSRSRLLPKAIAAFRKERPHLPLQVHDGPYADLLAGLRRGEIDLLIGALRSPIPVDGIEQRELFKDTLALIGRADHPAVRPGVTLESLVDYPWVVAPEGTPTRKRFNAMFAPLGRTPRSIVESGSLIVMRELLLATDHLGCISRQQAEVEARNHALAFIDYPMAETSRPIGLTVRAGWVPTRAQRAFLDALEAAASN